MQAKTILTAITLAAALTAGVAHAAAQPETPGSAFRVNTPRDAYTDGARISNRDGYTDGARITNRDGYIATRKVDPYLDGARGNDRRNPFYDGANAADSHPDLQVVARLDRTGVSASPERQADPYLDGARGNSPRDPYSEGARGANGSGEHFSA
ncbi:copper resistance protein CopQ [Cupriavidus sp. WGtm5]|uniref:copper resistance protein CopQ n=1 Tax=Cupriavidus sp. WGtm5 TaxID=2919926 RepID=UPI00209009B6|nr:copper resistance protein CopQ [Cupriavidus sp. WGtm5]MCO4889346.1 copper resistance protein CopQ [Cupriavidus sp. WGtm5]